MSIALIVTRGYGNGTLSGSITNVVTRGYSIGAPLAEHVGYLSGDISIEQSLSATINLSAALSATITLETQ